MGGSEAETADALAWRAWVNAEPDTYEEFQQGYAFDHDGNLLEELEVSYPEPAFAEFDFAYESDGIGDLEADLNCTSAGLGLDQLTLAEQDKANYAIDRIDHAINKVSMVRATFGSIQNRLEHKIANLDVSAENMQASESRIRDTDMAKEMMSFTKNQILSQASQSMLAQANSLPQGVLSLLQ
jgi:flagellin